MDIAHEIDSSLSPFVLSLAVDVDIRAKIHFLPSTRTEES